MGMMMVPASKVVALPGPVHGQRPVGPTTVHEWLQHFSAPGQGFVRSSHVCGMGMSHVPCTQICPAGQAEQPPQCEASLEVSTQASPQQAWPAPHVDALQPGPVVVTAGTPLPVRCTVNDGVSVAV